MKRCAPDMAISMWTVGYIITVFMLLLTEQQNLTQNIRHGAELLNSSQENPSAVSSHSQSLGPGCSSLPATITQPFDHIQSSILSTAALLTTSSHRASRFEQTHNLKPAAAPPVTPEPRRFTVGMQIIE